MERDIHQKMKAVKLFWEWGFFPEIDVRLFHTEGLAKVKMDMTDFDVLGVRISNELKEEKISADCKTAKSTSPINRAFWLKGLMSHLEVERGFLILSKKAALDHKLAAKKLNINLMDDQEFDTFSSNLISNTHLDEMSIIKPEVWTTFHSKTTSVSQLSKIWDYRKYRYWQDSHQRQIRYCLLEMRQASRSIGQKNPIITAMFLDVLSLFSLSLSSMSASLFQSHFIFENEKDLDISLKSYVYDGRENYEHLNSLTQRVLLMKKSMDSENTTSTATSNQFLSLPAWSQFKDLIMKLLVNPREASVVPMVLKFVLYERLLERSEVKISKVIKNVSPLSINLAIDVLRYYVLATEMSSLIWKPIYDELEQLILNFQNELLEDGIDIIKSVGSHASQIAQPTSSYSREAPSKIDTLKSEVLEYSELEQQESVRRREQTEEERSGRKEASSTEASSIPSSKDSKNIVDEDTRSLDNTLRDSDEVKNKMDTLTDSPSSNAAKGRKTALEQMSFFKEKPKNPEQK